MKFIVKVKLSLFYSNLPSDGYLCLDLAGKLPYSVIKADISSEKLAKKILNSATGIGENWEGIRIVQTGLNEYTDPEMLTWDIEHEHKILDINYMCILEGRQKLREGYEWVKISELQSKNLSDQDMNILREILSRRF